MINNNFDFKQLLDQTKPFLLPEYKEEIGAIDAKVIRSSLKTDDSSGLVEFTALLTKGDSINLNNRVYTWESLKAAMLDLKWAIDQQIVIGYLEHPPSVFDSNGVPVDVRRDTNPVLIIPTDIWAVDTEKALYIKARFVDSELGKQMSEAIKQDNFIPKISMRSMLACKPSFNGAEICDVKRIDGADIVENPAVPDAKLISWEEYVPPACAMDSVEKQLAYQNLLNFLTTLKTDKCKNIPGGCGCNSCHKSTGDKSKMNKNQKGLKIRGLRLDSASPTVLGLIQSGQLKLDGMVTEITWELLTKLYELIGSVKWYVSTEEQTLLREIAMLLEGHINNSPTPMPTNQPPASNLPTDSDPNNPMAGEEDSAKSFTTDHANLYIGIKQALNKFDDARKSTDSHNQSYQPTNNNGIDVISLARQLAALGATVEKIAGKVDNLASHHTQEAAKRAADESAAKRQSQINDLVNQFLSQDNIPIIDNLAMIGSVNTGLMTDGEKQELMTALRTAKDTTLEALQSAGKAVLIQIAKRQSADSKKAADKYLSNNGFDPSKATTGGSGATIAAGKADSFIERMREAFDRNEKIMYPHSHRHRQQLPQAYQDKVATLKDLMSKQMRDSLDFLDTGLATDSRQDILTEQAAMKLVSRFPNKGGILSKDSVILNNAPVARMIAGFQNLVIEQMFEDTELAVMLCRQVGTMEAAGFGKEGFTNFGRAYAYRLGYADNGASKPTGPNRRNFNSPRGVSVIGEIRLTNEWKQIVLDTDFAAAFRWAMLDFWFLSQQSGTGYDILAQAWLRLRERLLRSMNQYLLRNFYNQISEAGAIARIETVASVAPGASNGHYHIGEYVAITNQTNVTIGGVVVPVANTNIGAIVRVRGGNTSGEAFLNVPIVEPRNAQEIDQNGVFIDNPLNELKVQIGESQDGFLLPGILHNGNICKYNSDDELVAVGSNEKYYATNSGNGLVFISSGANPPATPAGSGDNRVRVHYSQETNFGYFNQDITGKKQGEVANEYYRYIAKQAGQTMGSQFISPDTLLTDNQFGAFLQGGTVFENQASPKGAVLNSVYTPGSLVANYGDITFLQNNTPRNNLENKNYENVDILMTAGRIMFATAPFFPSEPYKLPGVEGGNTVANQQWGIDMTTSMGIQVPRHVDAMGNTVNFPFKLIRRLGPNTVQDHYLG